MILMNTNINTDGGQEYILIVTKDYKVEDLTYVDSFESGLKKANKMLQKFLDKYDDGSANYLFDKGTAWDQATPENPCAWCNYFCSWEAYVCKAPYRQ